MPGDGIDWGQSEFCRPPYESEEESFSHFNVRAWAGKWHDATDNVPRTQFSLGLGPNGWWLCCYQEYGGARKPRLWKISLEEARRLCTQEGIEEPPELLKAFQLSELLQTHGFSHGDLGVSVGDQLAGTTQLPTDLKTWRPESHAASASKAATPSLHPGVENGSPEVHLRLCDQVRRLRPRAKLPALLVELMEDCELVTYSEVEEKVYGGDKTDSGTIKQLVHRTNEALKELPTCVYFTCGSEHVHKHRSPE